MSLPALWTYQKERFPFAKTAPLLAVFSAASISVSAEMSSRPLPIWSAFAAGFVVAMLLFFQMRVCDEYKDQEDDRRYRPERPIPRGLVSLNTVLTLGFVSLPLTTLAAWAWHPPLLWLLALVWFWLAAMTMEFGVPHWLKARPVLYLLSHMAIMPLIDLLLTAFEWMPSGSPATGLGLFFALSFVNGCVLEIGRKLWATTSEIEGVDTYSALWGPKKAATVWAICVVVSYSLLVGVGALTGVFWITLTLGAIAAGFCLWSVRSYAARPTLRAEKRMDALAGLWVFLCYGLAGFAPVFARSMSRLM